MHEDAGHYAGKHPEGTVLNKAAAEAVNKRVKNGRITCKDAHEAAREAGVSPSVVGQTLDLLEVRIKGCQLGLFGHKGADPEVNHGKAEMKEPKDSSALIEAVKAASDEEGISCSSLWAAAEASGFSKIEAAAVCDGLGININSCQLGAF